MPPVETAIPYERVGAGYYDTEYSVLGTWYLTPTKINIMTKKRSAPRKTKSTKRPTRKSPPAKRPKKISLGRPTVTAEEKLFMLFHEDYEARQVFQFLRAETVADLEQHSPQDIIHRLSRPIRETVDRIRTKLAERNRCLAGDEEFAADHKRSAPSK
jgi:hypothetical protein